MPVNRGELDRAVRAALQGPELRDVTFVERGFNVKRAKIERSGDNIVVVGSEDDNSYISRRRFGRNDRVSYEFEKKGGFVDLEKVEMDIRRGGVWRPIRENRRAILRVAKKLGEILIVILDKDGKKTGPPTDGPIAFRLTAEEQDEMAEVGFEELKSTLDGSWESEAQFLILNIALRAR